MDHSEATRTMASERYLLGELAPGERDAFEDHLFGCPECALDVRAADAFMQEAKVQLAESPAPALTPAAPVPEPFWRKLLLLFSFRPAFAAPVFATLLGVIAYQNFATIPQLRSQAAEPRIVPWASLHLGARGAQAQPLQADRLQGAVLLVQLPGSWNYSRYQFDFYDANAKQLWSRTVDAPTQPGGQSSDATLSLVIPPDGLEPASYTLAVAGFSSHGERTELDRRALAIRFDP